MKSFISFLTEQSFTTEFAKKLGDSLGVDWNKIDIEEFKKGLAVEKEHDDGTELDVVDSDKELAKIVLAHLKEKPNYYTLLKNVEEDAPANSVGAGNIAGFKEPIIGRTPLSRRKKNR